MKVVIAGGGSVGRFTAEQLVEAGHEVTIIENDRSVVREYADDASTGVKWHQGDACDVLVLAAAGVTMADVVASVTGDDEDNLVVSLLAKQEFGVPRVVARVNNPNNYWMFNEMWGVDVSVSTPHLITSLVQEAVTVGSFVRLMQLKGGKAELVEVTLAENSPAIDKALADIQFPGSCSRQPSVGAR